MTRRLRHRLLQGGSFLLAAVLLYFAFRGIDADAIMSAFRQANYQWVPPLVLLVVVANLFRAWRWNALLEALPEPTAGSDEQKPPEIRLRNSFSAVMIGYMVNYAAPRMGEVARTANMATRSRLKFSSVFGTVVVERIFDTAVLAFAILSTGVLLFDRMPVVKSTFVDPAVDRLDALPVTSLVLWIGGSIAVIAALVALFWRIFQHQQSALRQFWDNTFQPALVSFRDGMMTLKRSPKRWTIIGSTIGMWGGYLLMAYIPFRMLGLAGPHGIGLVDAWILMAIGSLGLLVPSPGGIGSYHYVTIQALVILYMVPEGPAASYAVLTHAAQLVFYTIAGVLALIYQGSSLGSLFQRSSEMREKANPSSDTSASGRSDPHNTSSRSATTQPETTQPEATS